MTTTTRCTALGIAAALALVTTSAVAQSDSSETLDRSRDLSRSLEAARQNNTIAPDDAAAPQEGTTGTQPDSAMLTPLLREGSYITEAPGRLYHDDAIGFWMFEADPAHVPTTIAARVPLRFVMLPCTKLQQMQRTVEASELETVFLLTGRVLVYGDFNYVLAIDAPLMEQRDTAATDANADSETSTVDDAEEGGEQSADDLIQQLRDEVPIARALAPLDEQGETEGIATLAPEGRLLTGRRGRVVRNARGGWEFVFTADADGLADPPMTILPCLLLEEMQRTAAERHARDTLRISGEVYTYRGRNYLLPTMYQIERLSGNIAR